MRRAILALAFFASACAPVVVTVPVGDGQLLPVEAQRVIDSATATAAVQATSNAVATAYRIQTQESVQVERDLATLAAAKTQDVISQTAVAATAGAQATIAAGETQAAGAARVQATGGAATATAQMASALATQTIKREEQLTLMQTSSAGASFLLKMLLFLVGIFGLYWLARWVGGMIDADLTRRRNAAAYRETPIGPVLVITSANGGLDYRLIAASAEEPEIVENVPAPARETIPYTVMGRTAEPLVSDWRTADDDSVRQELAGLLRESIAVDGNHATRIPRYSRLPGWSTNPEGWKRLTDRLMMAGHVTKVIGKNGGTFVTRRRTLYQLLTELLDHSLSLAPVDVVAETFART